MPSGHHLRVSLIAILTLSCIHYGRKDYYLGGVASFQTGDLPKAEERFLKALSQGDSIEAARRYLIRIYRLKGDKDKVKAQYLALLRSGMVKTDVIDYLADYYQEKGQFYNCYLTLKVGAKRVLEISNRVVDRKLLATLFTGLTSQGEVRDPISWVIKKGYLIPMPDGNFYPDDTVRIENLAVVLAPYLPAGRYIRSTDGPFGYALTKLDQQGLSPLLRPSDRPLRLKTAITILDRVKGYLK